MNTVRRNRERWAAVFVGAAVLSLFGFFLVWSATRGWWKSKIPYHAVLTTADGIRAGTRIEMSGVQIGTIRELHFSEDGEVIADLAVYRSFRNWIRANSRVYLVRPFVVGDKVLVVTPGTKDFELVADGGLLPADEVVGLTELLNGSKLLPYMKTLEGMATELRKLADLMLSQGGTEGLVKTLRALPPLIDRLSVMSGALGKVSTQMVKDGRMERVMGNMADLSDHLAKVGKNAPELAEDFTRMVGNLAVMTDEFKKVLPALAAVAPELPKSSKRVVEALDEAVVVLKAMQKTFLLRSSAREVREEEALKARQEESQGNAPERAPASP